MTFGSLVFCLPDFNRPSLLSLQSVNEMDEEERPEAPWWKCKKWALHILCRCFDRQVILHTHLVLRHNLYGTEEFQFGVV